MFDFIGDLFEAGADLVGDAVGGLFGGGGASAAASGGDFFDLAGGILGGGSGGSFWNSPITGHIAAAIGTELLREDPYDVAMAHERARRDAMDFGFTPVPRGNGLAPNMTIAAGYDREGGIKPPSADWWQETDEERRRREEELMPHA